MENTRAAELEAKRRYWEAHLSLKFLKNYYQMHSNILVFSIFAILKKYICTHVYIVFLLA